VVGRSNVGQGLWREGVAGGETAVRSGAAAVAPNGDGRGQVVERLELLCDPGSLQMIRAGARSPRLGASAHPGDGVVAGLGRVDGRPIACYAQDAGFMGGSVGAVHADTIDRLLALAGRSGMPVVSLVDSGGARMQEGVAALAGYARVFRRNAELTGVVPQISVVCGLAAGGGCYSPALTDFVVMTEGATMFLTGPGVVREVTGEVLDMAELGGPGVQARNGVCDLVAADDDAAVKLACRLLAYLPQRAGGDLPRADAAPPELADPGTEVPRSSRRVYDVRAVGGGIFDAGSLFELGSRWARSLFTGFARIGGLPVGVIANQPRYLAGVLDAKSSQKGARFVRTCDSFGLPLVVLVDTPGFMPGLRQERAGVIRFGATLVRAFATATVPRLTVILRKAYGGAYIAMNSKDLGADLVFAWPQAEIGVMSAEAATGIIHRRALATAPQPAAERRTRAAAYAQEHLGAEVAAAGGFVDEVIEPSETRSRLLAALESLAPEPPTTTLATR
jgi:acetyl-CoA carboxylase carboxyltransferase component